MKKHFNKTQCRQKGVSLIMTFFIMIIILVITLSISVLLYSEVKVIRNVGNSVAAYYAGESGIEKVLYYDRQVRAKYSTYSCDIANGDADCAGYSPYTVCSIKSTGDYYCAEILSRGLCSMLVLSITNPYCATGTGTNASIYCNSPPTPLTPTPLSLGGCNLDTCDGCEISFTTTFDNMEYTTQAYVGKLSPLATNYYLNVQSNGTFGSTSRKIEIQSASQYSQ